MVGVSPVAADTADTAPDAGAGGRTPVQQLADFAVACRDGGLPAAVSEDFVGRLLDVLGNCIAGKAESTSDADPDRAVLRVVARDGGTPESPGVVGSAERLPAATPRS